MKAVNATVLAGLQLTLGQEIVPLLTLELESGTRYLSDRAIVANGNTYEPLILEFGDLTTRDVGITEGAVATSETTITIDDRKRFPFAARFSDYFTATEPEGARATIHLVRPSAPTQLETVFVGYVEGFPDIGGPDLRLHLVDLLRWSDRVTLKPITLAEFPNARTGDVDKVLPVIYSETNISGVTGRQIFRRIDAFRLAYVSPNTYFEITHEALWRDGPGYGWIPASGGGEKFSYTAVDRALLRLTGVTRGIEGTSVVPAASLTAGVILYPALDDQEATPPAYGYDRYSTIRFAAHPIGTIGAGNTFRVNTVAVPSFGGINYFAGSNGEVRTYGFDGMNIADGTVDRLYLPLTATDELGVGAGDIVDGSDSTYRDFGASARVGTWYIIGGASSHGSGVLAVNAPDAGVTWDDHMEFIVTSQQREIVSQTWRRVGISFRWQVITQGTKTVDKARVLLHYRNTTDIPGGNSAIQHHNVGQYDLSTGGWPTASPRNNIAMVTNTTGTEGDDVFQTGNVKLDVLFGVDYSGAGTDWVFRVFDVRFFVVHHVAEPGTEGDTFTADVAGAYDDALGTYTGTPDSAIKNPADVRRHMIQEIGGIAAADIDVASFTAARAKYTAISSSYVLKGVSGDRTTLLDVLGQMDFTARARTIMSRGLVKNIFREDLTVRQAQAVDRALTKETLAGYPDCGRLTVEQVVNQIAVYQQALTAPTPSEVFVWPKSIAKTSDMATLKTISSSPLPFTQRDQDSVDEYGARETGDIPQAMLWSNAADATGLAAIKAFYTSFAPFPVLHIRRAEAYLDNYDLDPDDIVSLTWADEEGGYRLSQMNGGTKFLILPGGAVRFPSLRGLGRVFLQALQIGSEVPLFVENFDGGAVSTGWTSYLLGKHTDPPETPATSPNFSIVDAPWGGGEKALKVTIEADDYTSSGDFNANKERAELVRVPSAAEHLAYPEVWYAISLWFPTDYNYNSDAGELFQIPIQWHDNGLGANYEPPISVAYRQNAAGQSSFRLHYGLEGIGDPDQQGNINISRGVRNDLKFKIRWSRFSDGYCRAYMNGAFLVQFNGRNIYPAQGDIPNQFKIGIYRGFAQAQTNTLYHGRIRISPIDNI